MSDARPQLAAPRSNTPVLEMARNARFDAEVWHVLDARDERLFRDNVEYGVTSSTFVYSFPIRGADKPVSGVSIKGAEYLMQEFGGVRCEIVSSEEKIGAVLVSRTHPGKDRPPHHERVSYPELAAEPDYYSVVVEVTDIKRGNSVQVEVREDRIGYDSKKQPYERPHFQKIAQSKARRNGILSVIPADVQTEFIARMLRAGKGEDLTASVIDEKRRSVLAYAAQHAVALDRTVIERLTYDQIAGLGDAARESLAAFVNSVRALGLDVEQRTIPSGQANSEQSGRSPADDGSPRRPRGRPPGPPPQRGGGSPVEAPRQEGDVAASHSPAAGDQQRITFEV